MKNNKKNKCELEKFYEKHAVLLWIIGFILMALFHPKDADAAIYKDVWTCPEYKEMLLELGNDEFKARLYGEAEHERIADCSRDDEHFKFLLEYKEEEVEEGSRGPQSEEQDETTIFEVGYDTLSYVDFEENYYFSNGTASVNGFSSDKKIMYYQDNWSDGTRSEYQVTIMSCGPKQTKVLHSHICQSSADGLKVSMQDWEEGFLGDRTREEALKYIDRLEACKQALWQCKQVQFDKEFIDKAMDKKSRTSRGPQSIKSIKNELQIESVFVTPFEDSVGLISQEEPMALERITSELNIGFSEILLSEAWDMIQNDEGAFQDSDEVHRTPFGTLVQTKPGDQASWLGLIKKRSETARVIVDGQRFDASGFKLNKMSVLRLMRHAVERFYIKKGMSESEADKLALKIMLDGESVESVEGLSEICFGFNSEGDFLIKIRLGDIEMSIFY